VAVAVRAAAEGVPVGVIARALALPYDRILGFLHRAKTLGAITEIPVADWPPDKSNTTPNPRTRPVSQVSTTDLEFLCRQKFRLTNLEAGFLVVLLRCLFAEKEKLHAVIELQRNARPLRPERSQEVTDPKMVDVMICKLRRKLAVCDPGLVVQTSWGKGYFLEAAVKEIIFQQLNRRRGDTDAVDRGREAAVALPA